MEPSGSIRLLSLPINAAEAIVICGYPFGKRLQIGNDPRFVPSHFFGTVSSQQAAGTDAEMVFINCEAKSGNSGSPVISRMDGKVIGLLCGSVTRKNNAMTEEINYFRPIRLAWERFVAYPDPQDPNNP